MLSGKHPAGNIYCPRKHAADQGVCLVADIGAVPGPGDAGGEHQRARSAACGWPHG